MNPVAFKLSAEIKVRAYHGLDQSARLDIIIGGNQLQTIVTQDQQWYGMATRPERDGAYLIEVFVRNISFFSMYYWKEASGWHRSQISADSEAMLRFNKNPCADWSFNRRWYGLPQEFSALIGR